MPSGQYSAPMISVRTERAVCAVLLLAGFGWWATTGEDAAPSAADVAAMAGCGGVDRRTSGAGVRETVRCGTGGGHTVTVVSFEDNDRRDAWVDVVRKEVVVGGMLGRSEALIAGDLWAVRTDDGAAADRMLTAAHGWRV